ncbi:uncharacterized protein LOC108666511 [Hyalella azteca]|uniref:Uncharacterized protein LOC108666511 n=1 Tax=Hyalella azteca TaxID=294128 RepID=A0A8B7N5K9_HYAAZ|nr:uncharacterized protein LOC108666511 [Hyalella azteca]
MKLFHFHNLLFLLIFFLHMGAAADMGVSAEAAFTNTVNQEVQAGGLLQQHAAEGLPGAEWTSLNDMGGITLPNNNRKFGNSSQPSQTQLSNPRISMISKGNESSERSKISTQKLKLNCSFDGCDRVEKNPWQRFLLALLASNLDIQLDKIFSTKQKMDLNNFNSARASTENSYDNYTAYKIRGFANTETEDNSSEIQKTTVQKEVFHVEFMDKINKNTEYSTNKHVFNNLTVQKASKNNNNTYRKIIATTPEGVTPEINPLPRFSFHRIVVDTPQPRVVVAMTSSNPTKVDHFKYINQRSIPQTNILFDKVGEKEKKKEENIPSPMSFTSKSKMAFQRTPELNNLPPLDEANNGNPVTLRDEIKPYSDTHENSPLNYTSHEPHREDKENGPAIRAHHKGPAISDKAVNAGREPDIKFRSSDVASGSEIEKLHSPSMADQIRSWQNKIWLDDVKNHHLLSSIANTKHEWRPKTSVNITNMIESAVQKHTGYSKVLQNNDLHEEKDEIIEIDTKGKIKPRSDNGTLSSLASQSSTVPKITRRLNTIKKQRQFLRRWLARLRRHSGGHVKH